MFILGKILFSGFLPKGWQKMDLQFCEKTTFAIFLILLHEATVAYGLKKFWG